MGTIPSVAGLLGLLVTDNSLWPSLWYGWGICPAADLLSLRRSGVSLNILQYIFFPLFTEHGLLSQMLHSSDFTDRRLILPK